LPAQGSHMLGALVAADCLIDVPADTTRLTAGQTVTVWPLRWDG
jgi:molybdopterin biosynthesis enzyme